MLIYTAATRENGIKYETATTSAGNAWRKHCTTNICRFRHNNCLKIALLHLVYVKNTPILRHDEGGCVQVLFTILMVHRWAEAG